MHLFSFVATFYCLYATSAPPVLASAPRGSLESNRQMFLKDSPRRTLVELGSGIGGFSWTSMNTFKGQAISNPVSSSQSYTSKPITADTLSDSHLAFLGRSSDCFRKAAGFIQTRCAELDMNEEERVVAAISMTLCELATAKHHAPPMECDVFSARLHEPSYQSGFSEQQNEEFENSRGKCVNALSRSAQFWSSYSGYLREIPQLCFTFQRGNDIDNAKEIFRNISLNQDVFLQMVVDREHANKVHAERWSAYFDDAADIANEISLLAQRIQAEASGAVEELQKHGIDTLGIVSRSLSEFRSQVENDHSDQVKQINSALAGLSERHSHDLHAIVPELEVIMHELITQSFETARKEQGTVLSELTTSVQDQWRVLYSEFSAMHEAMSHLTASTTSTSLSITSHFRQTTQDIHQAHALISNSANPLSHVLDRLAERTNEHMEVLDVKAEELKEKLLPPTQEDQAWFSYESVTSERWWKGKLVSALGFLIRGATLSAWTNSAFLQMLEIIWIVTFWLLRQSLSTITSFIILCLSCRKYVQRVFVTSMSLNWTPDNSESNLERQTQGKNCYRDLNSYDKTSLTTRTFTHNSQEYQVQIPSPGAAFTHQENARLPQARVMTSRIRLSGVSTPSASSRFTSRIPDRLCMPNLA